MFAGCGIDPADPQNPPVFPSPSSSIILNISPMKTPISIPTAIFAWVFALLSMLTAADSPRLLEQEIELTTVKEQTTLVRSSGKLLSTVDLKLRNKGDFPLTPPLHAVIEFTDVGGGNLNGLTMTGMLGGIGQAPYQSFYRDLSPNIQTGLAPGAETTFSISFERPPATSVSYKVRIHGITNRLPVISPGGPYAGQSGTAISLNAGASSDPDGDSLTFSWDFGDGSTATGPEPSHIYGVPGIHTARLTVTDPQGGLATRDLEVLVSPSGSFALARTRTLDGNGHPLGGVVVSQTSPTGPSTLTSDPESGFLSLGGGAGEHTWSFSRDGYLTTHRRANLAAGAVRVVPFPWLAALNPQRTETSALNPTTLTSPSDEISLVLPPGAFAQIESVALTQIHGQCLPLPLPHGWSPLAAFHLDLPGTAAEPIAANLRLLQSVPAGSHIYLIRCNPEPLAWVTEQKITGTDSESIQTTLTHPGSYAVVIADSLPTGNPAQPVMGDALPSGAAPVVASAVSAVGAVNPSTQVASLDPAKVTASATVDFTNGSESLSSGAWFLADVEETYDLRDGQALKTPDYDSTFYAYQNPGDGTPTTATARFPLRPRLLFSPDQLTEAHIKVDVRALNVFSGAVLTPEGGVLALPGIRLKVPPLATPGTVAANIRPIATGGLDRFLGGFKGLLAFDLNIPSLPAGLGLEYVFTESYAPESHFVLARCISNNTVSGLQPVLRLVSDASGKLSISEPSSGPRLPGITGSGQFVLIRINAPEAIVTGVVRALGGSPLAGAVVRVADEPWLSLTGNAGTFSTLAKPGNRTVTGSNPADGNSGEATATLADASSHDEVEIQTAPTGPKIIATTPAAGAQRASLVAPVTIEFSEPIQPGTFAANGIRLRDVAGNQDVPGSVTLELSNRRASFFPNNPLVFATDYQIIVTNTIRDLQNLPIEGPLTFNFKTQPSDARPAGAQLVIYEPDAKNVPQAILDQLVGYDPEAKLSMVVAHGSPGTADSEVPVILVNEDTGETATVLSKPDGSFATFIRATEDEFVSAVFVNLNGSRITVPATRQNFDDGRVGLYNQGGILEAESDGGPVIVTVKPGSVARRSVFKISPLDVNYLEVILGDVDPPEGSQLFGGVNFEVQGDPLTESAAVSIPVDRGSMNIPVGDDPALGVYALVKVTEVNGLKLLQVLDKMEFADGRLHTASPPFLGLQDSAQVFGSMRDYNRQGGKAVLTGRVLSRPNGSTGTQEGRPVPGAVVYVDSLATDSSLDIAPLVAGRFVALAENDGSFRLLTPLPRHDTLAVALGAVSNSFPGTVAAGFASRVLPGPGTIAMTAELYFDSSKTLSDPLTAGPDKNSPIISFTEPKRTAATPGRFVPLQFAAHDNTAVPTLDVSLVSVLDPETGTPIQASHYTFQTGTPGSSGFSTFRTVTIKVDRPADVKLRATSTDGRGNPEAVLERTVVIKPASNSPSASNDRRGPYVLSTEPHNGARFANRFAPVTIIFNEPIDTTFQNDLLDGISISPPAGTPYFEINDDRRQFSLYYPDLKAGTSYTFTVASSFGSITDDSGNPFDQDAIPDDILTHFVSDFKTRDEPRAATPVENGAGVVEKDGYFYFIDRGAGGKLRIVRKLPSDANAQLVHSEPLMDYPRDVLLVPNYSYHLPNGIGPVNVRTHRDLLVITGGLVGGSEDVGFEGLGPWLQVFDITDPNDPEGLALKIISDSPSAVFAKLDWSPPMLGLLELNPAETAIHYVNLPLFLWANHRNHRRDDDPAAGAGGYDVNGDGDYVDQGELFPQPASASPSVGLINAGLVATHLPIVGRFTDFDVGLGGRFLGVTGTFYANAGSYYMTLITGGQRLSSESYPNLSSTHYFDGFAKRLLTVFGVALQNSSGFRIANLAIVSVDKKIVILDITNSLTPVLVSTIDTININSNLGHTQSALLRPDGLIAVSCSGGMLILDPKRLALEEKPGALHPALLGFYDGIGAGTRAFVSHDQVFAVNQGSVALLSARGISVPVTVTGIIAEDINDAATPPDFPPANYVPPTPVIRTSKPDPATGRHLIEITEQVLLPNLPPTMRFTAVFDPPNAVIPRNFPVWRLNGAEVARGQRVEVNIPEYSNTFGSLFPPLVNLIGAQHHQMVAENFRVDISLYPDDKSEAKINVGDLVSKVREGIIVLQEKINEAAGTGLLTGGFEVTPPGTVTFALANQWKECDDLSNANSNKVFWTFDAEAGFDPLVGVSGRINFGPRVAGSIGLVLFVEAYGQLTLKGKLSRDQTASITSTVGLGGKVGIKAGAEANAGIAAVVIEADAPVSFGATITASTQNISGNVSAAFDGLAAKITVRTLGGILEFSDEVNLVPGRPLIQPTPLILKTFQ
jgi:PKD repeat protein